VEPCPAPFTECHIPFVTDVCVDTARDPMRCGDCSTVCGPTETCTRGTCACEAPSLACGADCIDPATDAANCGRCGRSCGGGACVGGDCMPARIVDFGYAAVQDASAVYYATAGKTVMRLDKRDATIAKLGDIALLNELAVDSTRIYAIEKS